MGYMKSVLKGGLSSAMGQIKSYDISSKVNSQLSSVGVKVPNIGLSDSVKNLKFDIDPSILKLPAGVENYISPIANGVLSNVKVPEELGKLGIPLPEMPDLSSVTSDVDKFMSGMGIDTNKLGIRSVSDILKEPDLSALKQVQFESTVDLNNMPDLSHALDDFQMPNIDELKQLGVDVNSIF